jgi:hypothetical protein
MTASRRKVSKGPPIMRSKAGAVVTVVAFFCFAAYDPYCGFPQYADFEGEIMGEGVRARLDHTRLNGKRL